MKKILAICLFAVFHIFSVRAGDTVSTRHHFHFSLTNAMSGSFAMINGQGATDFTHTDSWPDFWDSTHYKLRVGYSVYAQIKYSYDVCRYLSVQTGLGYMLTSHHYDVPIAYIDGWGGRNVVGNTVRRYIGFLSWPIEARVKIPIHHDAISVTVGTHYCVGANMTTIEFGQMGGLGSGGLSKITKSSGAVGAVTGGALFRIGYEKKLNKYHSIDIGAVAHLWDLYGNFDDSPSTGARTYKYYVGIDVDFLLGIKPRHHRSDSGKSAK
jgi:hypothetical protein